MGEGEVKFYVGFAFVAFVFVAVVVAFVAVCDVLFGIVVVHLGFGVAAGLSCVNCTQKKKVNFQFLVLPFPPPSHLSYVCKSSSSYSNSDSSVGAPRGRGMLCCWEGSAGRFEIRLFWLVARLLLL